ncbi:MAG TPA: HAD family phosphatase [Verrucomicrobiae bacterium]|nr:HAD family phosphatase [Verrucomicrobiae bacterium]
MKCIEAVLFDLDGVIVNSEPHHERAFLQVFEEIGYGGTHGIRFSDFIGRSDLTVWHEFMARHNPPFAMAELAALKQKRVLDLMRAAQPIFEGLPDLVRKLAAKFPLAVASGSQHPVIEAVLSMKNLRPYFSTVVSVTDVKQGKPAPDIFLRAAELLEVSPAKCCVIEDSKPGVAAGRAAGMQVIAITNTYPAGELNAAHHVVKTYEEIEKILIQ